MSCEVADHSVIEPLRIALNHSSNDVDRPSRSNRCYRSHCGFFGSLNEKPGFLIYVSTQERGVGVTMHPANKSRDVNIANITVLENG